MRRIESRLAAVLLAAWVTSSTQTVGSAEEKPAPPGCHWQAIPELKAHLAVPDGWTFEEAPSSVGLAYMVAPGEEDLGTRYRLEVELGRDPSTVVDEARWFVERPRQSGELMEPLEEQTIGVVTAFSTVVYYQPARVGAPAITVGYLALANERTGTLYRIRLDIPADEAERVLPVANHLFQTIRVDDEI